MTYASKESGGQRNDHLLQTEPGDNGGAEERLVHGLPANVVAAILATSSGITALQGFVDGLEAALAALNAAVDGLEGFSDGIETKLDALTTTNSPAAGLCAQESVTTSSAAFGSLAANLGVWVKNISTAAQKVYVRYAAQGAVTTSNGYELDVGAEHFFPCRNASELVRIASGASASVSVHAI